VLRARKSLESPRQKVRIAEGLTSRYQDAYSMNQFITIAWGSSCLLATSKLLLGSSGPSQSSVKPGLVIKCPMGNTETYRERKVEYNKLILNAK